MRNSQRIAKREVKGADVCHFALSIPDFVCYNTLDATRGGENMAQRRLRVMIVDDNPVVAGRIAALLTEDPRITVCDRVESGLLAFARIASDRPDIVLMDLEMPGIGGLAAIKRIKDLIAPPQVIVVTLYDSEEVRSQALAVGADAFVPKSRIANDLVETVLASSPEYLQQHGAAAA